MIWDISSGVKLQVLRGGHSRGILDLAIDPLSSYYTDEAHEVDTDGESTSAERDGAGEQHKREEEKGITLFSASSDRTIRRFALTLRHERPHLEETHPEDPIICHETSVYALLFDNDGDLWTASADGYTKCLARSRGWESDTEIQHGDYVRAVVVDDVGGYIVTAGRSEEVKVWEKGSGKLVHVYGGHFDEITAMTLVEKRREVVSVGIDGTVRRWSVKSQDLEKVKHDAEEEAQKRERGEDVIEDEEVKGGKGKENGKVAMTEEEERESEDLMGDSD